MGPGEAGTAGRRLVATLRLWWHYLADHPDFRRHPVRILARTAQFRIRCLLGLATEITLERWGVRMELPSVPGASTTLFVHRDAYEPELRFLEQALRPGSVVIDGGANLGVYSLVAARLVGADGRVLALEPASEVLPSLERNLRLNGLRNVRVFRMALSNETGRASLFLHGGDSGRYSLGGDGAGTTPSEQVDTTTLDSVVETAGVGRVDLIKLDLEGAEELALRGATTTLRRYRPVVILEEFPEGAARLGLVPEGARRLLADMGYRILAHTGRPRRSIAPRNLVALPPEPAS